MNREQAINYLHSSGMSEEQIQTIANAFSYNAEAYKKAFEDIRAEMELLEPRSHYTQKMKDDALAIVDKYNPAKATEPTYYHDTEHDVDIEWGED